MQTFIGSRGVSGGLANLVNRFCMVHLLDSPVKKLYDVDERIPLAEWYNILSGLYKQYPKDDLGIEIGKMVEASDIGVVAYLSMGCDKVGDVVALFRDYQRIWYHISLVEMEATEHDYIFSWETPPYVKAGEFVTEARLVNDIGFSILMTFINSLVVPAKFQANRMEFDTSAPSTTSYHVAFFQCPVLFNTSKNKIYYDKSMFDLKVNSLYSDKTLNRILEKNAKNLLLKYPQDLCFNELVYKNIILAIQHNHIDIKYVASLMNMSPRLLQYKLKLANSSFSEKLNQIRKSLALNYLEDETLNINEISVLLGYKEQSSFNRAFKLWTGKSPLQWRQSEVEH